MAVLGREITIRENALTAGIYSDFHRLVGFMDYEEADVRTALNNTLYSVVIYEEDTPIGIARVVGDGRIVFLIKDVIVNPNYQGQKIGRELMLAVMDYIKANGCYNAYVALMAAKGTEEFYEKFGFIRRPNQCLGSGMVLFLDN